MAPVGSPKDREGAHRGRSSRARCGRGPLRVRRDVTRTLFGHRFALATATDRTHETFTKRLLYERYRTILNVTFDTASNANDYNNSEVCALYHDPISPLLTRQRVGKPARNRAAWP